MKNEPQPQRPDDVRYMTGWFMVKIRGRYREAKKMAEQFVADRKK